MINIQVVDIDFIGDDGWEVEFLLECFFCNTAKTKKILLTRLYGVRYVGCAECRHYAEIKIQ